MDKFDQYKRLLRLGIAGIEIFIETLFFVYVWNEVYRELRVTMFLNKGNWMMIGFYVLYLIVFVYLYGGTKMCIRDRFRTMYMFHKILNDCQTLYETKGEKRQ